jgi:chemotaxis signal transduction protein
MMSQAIQELDLLSSIGLEGVPASLVLDEPFSKSNCEKFVAFYLGETLFGVPAEEVAEVIHPFRVTPLPGMMSNLIGITAVRGEVVGVLDLRQASGMPPATPGAKERLIVLNPPGVRTQLSFPVDRMHEIVVLSAKDIAAPRETSLNFVSGVARLAAGDIRIIDVQRLPDLLGFN